MGANALDDKAVSRLRTQGMIAVCVSALLAGCGGGGGDYNNTPPPASQNPPPPPATAFSISDTATLDLNDNDLILRPANQTDRNNLLTRLRDHAATDVVMPCPISIRGSSSRAIPSGPTSSVCAESATS